MTIFETVLVARTPAASGSPTLTVVDRLVSDQVTYIDELNKPGSATLQCPVWALTADVQAVLVNLRVTPCEVWIYADSTLAWSGEIQTMQIQNQTLTINCVGLMGYLARMGITADTTFSATDQFTIAKSLVNTWQAQSYGNFGLVTSGIGTSGVVRDRTYLQKDLKDVLSAVTDLANVIDGFDFWVDPTTRALTFAYPTRGTDLSASVFIDSRNVDSNTSISVSVAPGDVVSDVGLTSSAQTTAGAQVSLYSYRTNSTTESTFGRCWAGVSADSVSVQATLDGQGDAYLSTRAEQLLTPSLTLIPNVGLGTVPGAVHPGDSVAYAYDAGLGMQSGTFRVSKVTVAVDPNGTDSQPRISLEFV